MIPAPLTAAEHLHGLDVTLLGARERPTEARDLAALFATSVVTSAGPPAALLIELPAREIGGRLPAWQEIEAFSALTAARDQIASQDGAWLAQRIGSGTAPGWSSTEIYVGDNLLSHDNSTVVPLFAKLLELAHSQVRATT